MGTELAMLRYVRTHWIDKPSDIGLLIVGVVLAIAVNYFLPKYFPQLSETTVKLIFYVVIAVVAIIWFTVVGT